MLMRVEYDPKEHDTFLTDVLRRGKKGSTSFEGARSAAPEDWAAEFVRHWL